MGEKLLAQRVLTLLRDTYGKSSREAETALQWAADMRDWLWPDRAWADPATGAEGDAIAWDSLARLAGDIDTSEPLPDLFGTIDTALDLLDLDEFDRELIVATTAFERLPRLTHLSSRLAMAGCDMLSLIGQIAGAPATAAEATVRRSQAMALGLLYIERQYAGAVELKLHWAFAQLVDQSSLDDDKIVSALAGTVQSPSLERADFAEHGNEFDLLVRLLSGALKSRAKGVNVLIYGPPGTGKTEFARTLAAEVGARLFAVGEADTDGDEPTRMDRLAALNGRSACLSGGATAWCCSTSSRICSPRLRLRRAVSGAPGRRSS